MDRTRADRDGLHGGRHAQNGARRRCRRSSCRREPRGGTSLGARSSPSPGSASSPSSSCCSSFAPRPAPSGSWSPRTCPPTRSARRRRRSRRPASRTACRRAGSGIEVPADMSAKAAAALMSAGIAAKGGRMDCAKQFGEGGSMMSGTSAGDAPSSSRPARSRRPPTTSRTIEGVTKASVDVTLPDEVAVPRGGAAGQGERRARPRRQLAREDRDPRHPADRRRALLGPQAHVRLRSPTRRGALISARRRGRGRVTRRR